MAVSSVPLSGCWLLCGLCVTGLVWVGLDSSHRGWASWQDVPSFKKLQRLCCQGGQPHTSQARPNPSPPHAWLGDTTHTILTLANLHQAVTSSRQWFHTTQQNSSQSTTGTQQCSTSVSLYPNCHGSCRVDNQLGRAAHGYATTRAHMPMLPDLFVQLVFNTCVEQCLQPLCWWLHAGTLPARAQHTTRNTCSTVTHPHTSSCQSPVPLASLGLLLLPF